MTEKIICAGFGGQGIMIMGQLLARAALEKGHHVSWLPSYGAEVRGGTAHCHLIISSQQITSPYVEIADTCIVMNEPSLIKFEKKIKKGGFLLINSSLIKRKARRKDIKVCRVPLTELAVELGNIKVANCIGLGAYITNKRLFTKDELFSTIEKMAPKGKRMLIDINKQAVEAGIESVLLKKECK